MQAEYVFKYYNNDNDNDDDDDDDDNNKQSSRNIISIYLLIMKMPSLTDY